MNKTLPDLISRGKDHLALILGLLISAPILFTQALRFSFPLGYAGMFTLMAEGVVRENFALPMWIPHYGPGGIPFVYPPFGAYVFALALKMGVSTWAYLRFAPALLTLLSMIPLFFLAWELLDSKIAALISILLIVTTPMVFYTHVWSAGVVRAPALGFCFTGLLFYLRSIKAFSWRSFWLAGLFLGLLLMTHWLYVAFAALVGAAFLISQKKAANLRVAIGILLVALLLAAPWLALIIARHGLDSILLASSSHRNIDFFMFLASGPAALQFLSENIQYVSANGLLAFLAAPGFILLIIRKKFHLPLAFLLTLFMGEASFYTPILASLAAGTFGALVYEKITGVTHKPRILKIAFVGLVVLSTAAILFTAWNGLDRIARNQPEIDDHSIVMSKFVREETAPDLTYLYIGKINEAEWFPYLLDRTPVFALWGSEWIGTYALQLDILTTLRECQLQQDWPCMQALLQQQNSAPDLLISPNQRWLRQQIKDARSWEIIYTDERYLVWQKKN